MRELLKLIFKNKSLHPAIEPLLWVAVTVLVSTIFVNILLYVMNLIHHQGIK